MISNIVSWGQVWNYDIEYRIMRSSLIMWYWILYHEVWIWYPYIAILKSHNAQAICDSSWSEWRQLRRKCHWRENRRKKYFLNLFDPEENIMERKTATFRIKFLNWREGWRNVYLLWASDYSQIKIVQNINFNTLM